MSKINGTFWAHLHPDDPAWSVLSDKEEDMEAKAQTERDTILVITVFSLLIILFVWITIY